MSETASQDQRETVLVVDDDVITRMNLSEYLRHCGYRVIEAASVTEARTVLEDPHIKVDVLFADLQASSSDTFALAQWVRQDHPDTAIILAGTAKGAAKAAAEICEDGPLQKPFEPDTLVRRIRRMKTARDKG